MEKELFYVTCEMMMEHLERLAIFFATEFTAEEGYGTTFPIARVCSVINLHVT
jgi:hypothetical protein